MIGIRKPLEVPVTLTRRGRAACSRCCTSYDAGERVFTFDRRIYGATDVKAALVAAQFGKCAYCEEKVGQEGDVEHFRPKGEWCQEAEGRTESPGYYWLAYSWDNLLLSCTTCNQRYKRSHFPLSLPDERARCHTDDLNQEDPLLLDPSICDPEQHIGFREEVAFAIGDSDYGQATIRIVGLNRDTLLEARLQHLQYLAACRLALDCEADLSMSPRGRALIEHARKMMPAAVKDDARFTSLSRSAAASGFPDPLSPRHRLQPEL